MSAAELEGPERRPRPAPDIERTDTLRTGQFVRAETEQRNAGIGNIDRN
jgi:hypothetical protein